MTSSMRDLFLSFPEVHTPGYWRDTVRKPLNDAIKGASKRDSLKLTRYWRGIMAGWDILGFTGPQYTEHKGPITVPDVEFNWQDFFSPISKPVVVTSASGTGKGHGESKVTDYDGPLQSYGEDGKPIPLCKTCLWPVTMPSDTSIVWETCKCMPGDSQ